MLIIGHRGAAALAPENSLEALKKGFDVGADALEFDVQLTRDKQLIVIHDSSLLRTHGSRVYIRWSSHASIQAAASKGHKIATLEEVLDMFFGKVLLNLEIKGRGVGKQVVDLLEKKYIKKPADWHNILLSSFKPTELIAVRRVSRHAQLAMLHNRNPLLFLAYQRFLNLTAVGFHRLHVNPLALDIAKRLELFCYVYTINRIEAARRFEILGIDGIVTDDPHLMRNKIDEVDNA